ncbi:MAG: DUF4345 domain-containing protein [Acidimicrobiia bacterium]
MVRGLQVVLTILGVVAIGAGTLALVTGAALVPGGDEVTASVDSEFRFYAAWYVGAGVVALRAARRVESEGRTIRALCAFLFLAACARALSIIVVGAPQAWFLVLMGIEFVIPAVIVPWQAAVAEAGDRNRVKPDAAGR